MAEIEFRQEVAVWTQSEIPGGPVLMTIDFDVENDPNRRAEVIGVATALAIRGRRTEFGLGQAYSLRGIGSTIIDINRADHRETIGVVCVRGARAEMAVRNFCDSFACKFDESSQMGDALTALSLAIRPGCIGVVPR